MQLQGWHMLLPAATFSKKMGKREGTAQKKKQNEDKQPYKKRFLFAAMLSFAKRGKTAKKEKKKSKHKEFLKEKLSLLKFSKKQLLLRTSGSSPHLLHAQFLRIKVPLLNTLKSTEEQQENSCRKRSSVTPERGRHASHLHCLEPD